MENNTLKSDSMQSFRIFLHPDFTSVTLVVDIWNEEKKQYDLVTKQPIYVDQLDIRVGEHVNNVLRRVCTEASAKVRELRKGKH